nr:F0F1 ATP synthase subunit delta [Limibaculum sp. NKW23]
MSDATMLTSTIAGRYATALFDLAQEQDALERVETDIGALKAAIGESADLRLLIQSPLYGRDQQARAMATITDRMGLGPITANLIGLMAYKRRLFVLPAVAEIFTALLAEHRGEVTAKVTAARLLSDAQIEALKTTLRAKLEREVKLDIMIDPAIIGGLIVKVGSRMIDTSIRSKLAGLQNAMREVG